MANTLSATSQISTRLLARSHDYLELTKPKVVLLLMLTAVVGMFLSTHAPIPTQVLLLGSVSLAMAMAAGAVVNHVVDQRIDAIMKRTHRRPIVQGKIKPLNALIFAFILLSISMTTLCLSVNVLTALLTLFGFVGYAVIYTLFLKRATPQNIVIGGVAGAIPPLLGWTAVTGHFDPYALLPVLIIFTWTPPHFWPLALHRRDDYAAAGIPMLPVTHGDEFTRSSIFNYTLLLCIVTMLPFVTGMSGLIYLATAILLNALFVYYAWRLKFARYKGIEMKTFGWSIIYLAILFAALLIDHALT